MHIARAYRAADRAWVRDLIGDTAIDAKGNHIEIVEDGSDKALAVWFEPEDGPPILGEVIATPARQKMFYAAILAVIEALVAKGTRAARPPSAMSGS